MPYFDNLAAEAADWAAWADLNERRAYAAAIFNSLPRDERAAAIDAIRRLDE